MFDAIAPSPERSRGAPPSPNFLCEDEKGNIYILSKKRRENGRVDTTITSDRSRRAAQHAAGVASLEDVRVYSGIPSSSLSSNGEEEEKEEEGIDDPMEGEEGEDDDERKEHTVNAKKPPKIKKLPSLVSNILVRSITPTLSGVVRSITPTLYREAMESKLNEFRGLSSKLSPPPPPKD
mmetsp:Transcript_629/g.2285  ORF Transcript_629/g.2285 Transcript_629/m.2285 type:complete len:179 (+) Transcript_629:84-620(+)